MTSVAKVPASPPARAHDHRTRPRLSFRAQVRAISPIVVYGLLLLAFTVALVSIPMHRRVAADPDPIVRALLGAQLFRMEVWLAPLFLLCGSIAAVYALARARRAAASMLRLQEGMARLAVGDAEPLNFAPGDYFHPLEAPFNGIEKRIEQLTRGNLDMLRFFRHNLEGIAQRVVSPGHTDTEIRESVQVLIRDVESEIKKLQMKS